MFITELLDSISVCGTEVFSDDFFCDVATDVFTVVARFLALDFLLFRFEEFGADVLIVIGGIVG